MPRPTPVLSPVEGPDALRPTTFPRIGGLDGVAALRDRLGELGIDMPADDAALAAAESPLAQPLDLGVVNGAVRTCTNRFVIQPMEGWDGTVDGYPSDLTVRRWRNFGRSGAGWIWGGEAVAVQPDGRANPHQLIMSDATAASIGALRAELVDAAGEGGAPIIGLQLTHSGRWSRPTSAGFAPRIAFRHPILDARAGVSDDSAVLGDAEVDRLITAFARAAFLAQEEGFEFVDVKHCHGYLLHELLAARRRPGRYGGTTLAARTRLLRATIEAVRVAAPRLAIGVRLSVFDCVPHRPASVDAEGKRGPGVPEICELPYEHAFGLDANAPAHIDLAEPIALCRLLRELDVTWLNVTAGSPYYVPHVQRPAAFPPSDGYAPPEDPLVGVARLLDAARRIKAAVPEMVVVSTGWSYLQEYIPHVAQACVRAGWFDAVGLGRMVLAYPELPADVLAGRQLQRKRLCRTFSDCTTAPRNGLVSGCYPLDPFYRSRLEHAALERVKHRVP
jgi:2,4-dienoyl-CoA reductase-like NADH-dependent reductase (Old Yellow Enzyme family)